jgi:hypothetical protein
MENRAPPPGKRRSEWAQFLESAAAQWTKEKLRIPIARNVGGGRKNKWTPDEDHTLGCAVGQFGENSWRKVAIVVPGRTSKQCRERWLAQLSPSLVRDEWSANEDLVLVEKQRELGNQWVKIKEFLPGRSPVAVKNRWTWLCRRDVPNHTSEFQQIVEAKNRAQSNKLEDQMPDFGECCFDRDDFSFPQFNFNGNTEVPGFA